MPLVLQHAAIMKVDGDGDSKYYNEYLKNELADLMPNGVLCFPYAK